MYVFNMNTVDIHIGTDLSVVFLTRDAGRHFTWPPEQYTKACLAPEVGQTRDRSAPPPTDQNLLL